MTDDGPAHRDESFHQLFQELIEGFALHEIVCDGQGVPIDYRFLEANPAFEEQTGLRVADIIGHTVREVIPGIEDEWIERYGAVALTGESNSFVLAADPLGRVYQVRAYRPAPMQFATVFSDVTELRKTQQALEESEMQYRELYEQSPVGYQSLDSEGRFLMVNEAWLGTLGYESDDVIGKWFGDFLPPEYAGAFRERFPLFKSLGKIHSEFEMVRGDGTRVTVAFEGRIAHDEQGGFKRTHCVIQDVTDARKEEASLRGSVERLAQIISMAPFPIMLHAEDGEVIQINDVWEELTGYAHADIPTTSQWALKAHGSRSTVAQKDIDALYGLEGRDEEGEYDIRTSSGESRVWDFCSSPVGKLPDGRRLVMSTAKDVTERKRAEEDARQQAYTLRGIIESVQSPIYSVDRDHRFTSFNPAYAAATAALGIDIHIGDCLLEQQPDSETAEQTKRLLDRALAGEYVVDERVSDDEAIGRRHFEVSHNPVHDDSGAIVGVAVLAHDITERKHMEEERRTRQEHLETLVAQRTEELQEANAAKSAFLANMSHELRTPLNSVIGYSGIMLQGLAGELNDEQSKQLRMISSSGKHLLELVNDVLDLAKVEAGETRVKMAPVDVPAMMDSVVDSVAPLAHAKGLELTLSVAPDVGTMVSDIVRVEQILLNLAGNAVKFTDHGSVNVSVKRGGGRIVFSVRDTGSGIPAEELPRVFEEFYQVQRPDVAKSEGTGLGLSVSRRLVEVLGGTIEASSEVRKGSTFTVSLPA